MTGLEVVLTLLVIVLWFVAMRLHAETVVLRQERDETLRQLKALLVSYSKGVDKRPKPR